ncbi:SDR family oxidoreductase [Ferviditalea candida]|uniref:SDR family oxidoreductase n=1 Tax=Ferviditalea candida TaxID=3108399 RepID=A0ABU5ZGJ0_9BACL|nr:SDR family oxidoreductase [Paenibacillaceae bacterium T2]
MATYLVTGGAGFIGSGLVEALLKRHHEVRVLDNFSSGTVHNLREVQRDVVLIHGDIRDPEACRKAVSGADYVLHHAALSSVPQSVANPAAVHDVNVTGTLNILIAARDCGVKRVVLASSSAVYGNSPELPEVETLRPDPVSPYGVSKLFLETYAGLFYQAYGLETISLRYFNVFGPRQDPDSQYAAVIPKFITALLGGRAPVIFGDGEQTRDFVFIEDVVQANLQACAAGLDACGRAYNVAGGERISVNRLVQEIGQLLNEQTEPLYEAARPGDIRHSYADISLSADLLNFRPEVSLRSGLSRTIAWYRETVINDK